MVCATVAFDKLSWSLVPQLSTATVVGDSGVNSEDNRWRSCVAEPNQRYDLLD